MRPLLPLSGSSGFPGCVRILNKKGKARSKLIFQRREEMLFPASYKTGANKTDTGAHCPANNVVMGGGRLRKQTSGRRARLIFPCKCECESVCVRARSRKILRLVEMGPALFRPIFVSNDAKRDLAPQSTQGTKKEKKTIERKGEGKRQDSPQTHPTGSSQTLQGLGQRQTRNSQLNSTPGQARSSRQLSLG